VRKYTSVGLPRSFRRGSLWGPLGTESAPLETYSVAIETLPVVVSAAMRRVERITFICDVFRIAIAHRAEPAGARPFGPRFLHLTTQSDKSNLAFYCPNLE